MHDLEQIDFDVRLKDCGDTWAAPLWLTPDFWKGAGRSGEIDLVEMCPSGAVHTNFGGGLPTDSKPTYPKLWKSADPNSFSGHVTLWKKKSSKAGGRSSIAVKMCKHEHKDKHGHCLLTDAAFYPGIYDSYACTDGHNCRFMFVSDIWNALESDGGAKACMAPAGVSKANCGFSIRNLRVKGPKFKGKCAALQGRQYVEEALVGPKDSMMVLGAYVGFFSVLSLFIRRMKHIS